MKYITPGMLYVSRSNGFAGTITFLLYEDVTRPGHLYSRIVYWPIDNRICIQTMNPVGDKLLCR